VIAEIATAVHTTGINWPSVLTIVCAIVGALAIIFGVIARAVSNSVTSAIDHFRIEVITKMDTRLALLELAVFGKKNKE
jgi:hypothetical protein